MHAHWKPPGESQFPTGRSSRQCNHKGYANKMNSLYFSVFFCSFSIIFLIMNACISWFLGILLYSSIPQIARKSVHLCVILPWITMIASCGRLTLHPVCHKAKGSCLVGEKVLGNGRNQNLWTRHGLKFWGFLKNKITCLVLFFLRFLWNQIEEVKNSVLSNILVWFFMFFHFFVQRKLDNIVKGNLKPFAICCLKNIASKDEGQHLFGKINSTNSDKLLGN